MSMIPGKRFDSGADEEDSPLNISATLASHIIERAKEAYAGLPQTEGSDIDVAERRGAEADFDELAQIIDDLNEDERIDLVALMWIGRGTFSADELDQARATARSEATHATSDYLLSTPLVGDYLADGLEAFGLAVEGG